MIHWDRIEEGCWGWQAPQFAHNYYVYQVLWFGDSTVLVRLMNREQTIEVPRMMV